MPEREKSLLLDRSQTSQAPRLHEEHARSIDHLEGLRSKPGQLTTGINGKVGRRTLDAVEHALAALQPPRQFVVAAPPGTGKTSHASALLTACVRAAEDKPGQPFGGLFVVDQITKADETYGDVAALSSDDVAVWTSDHDVESKRKPRKVLNPAAKFAVDDLPHKAVVIVTQAFLRGPRGDKARFVFRHGQLVPRALTIYDEQVQPVQVYDVLQSQAIAVREAVSGRLTAEAVHLTALIDFMEEKTKQRMLFPLDSEATSAPPLETPKHDPEGWAQAAQACQWFTTEPAERLVRQYADTVPYIENVIGFGGQVARGCAFIARRGYVDRGIHFMGYEALEAPKHSSVLLDATADIDGVNEICRWRVPLDVPQVHYDNLHIIHAEPYTTANLSEFLRTQDNRRRYRDEHMMPLIRQFMRPEQKGLVVCKQRLLEERDVPDWPEGDPRFRHREKLITEYTWEVGGRKLAVTYWGGPGIGANYWNEADVVFQFGEHHLPLRVQIATVQGLQGLRATEGLLRKINTTNTKSPVLNVFTEGHLLRLMKQLAMRGNARHFSREGVCGRQVLVLTCDFRRLLANADRLFPGAKLSKWRPQGTHGDTKGSQAATQPERMLEVFTEPELPEELTGDQVASRLGAGSWRSIRTNVMTPEVRRALKNLGWTYSGKPGPGGGTTFVRSLDPMLTPVALKGC